MVYAPGWQVWGPPNFRITTLSVPLEFIARKLCPDLVIVPIHFPRYIEMSKQVMAIFREYDPNMCAAGCDEGYIKYMLLCNPSPLIPHVQFQYHAVLRRALDNCGRVCARDARTRT